MSVSDKELERVVLPFIDEYQHFYDSDEELREEVDCSSVSNFLRYSYKDAYHFLGENESVYTQIFAHLGLLPEEKNPYYQMMKRIEAEYGLDRDIVEVGGGMIPVLGMEIAKRQLEIGKGSITIYDPKAFIKTANGAKIINSYFTEATSPALKEGDLLIGRKPCDATIGMIKAANKRNVEFYISLCDCDHTPTEYRLTHGGLRGCIWHDYVKDVATSTLPKDMDLKVEEEQSVMNDMYHVTVIKTKKMR